MKKILVVNDFSIYPPDHGGKVRIFNVYKEISKNYDVTYVCFGKGRKIETTRQDGGPLEVKVPKPGYQRFFESFLSWIFRGVSVDDLISMYVCRHDNRLRKALDTHARDADVIICSLPYMYPAVKRHARGRLLAYESHNVEYRLKRSILGDGLISRLLCHGVKSVEGGLYRKADVVFATSDDDIVDLANIYGRRDNVNLSPNGTDTGLYGDHAEKKISGGRPIVLFMGSAHPPNVLAARAIFRDIAPALPEMFFLLVGSICHSMKDQPKRDNVELAYIVADEKKVDLLMSADLALNPMMSGSGTNLKMLEYMAAGLPVITTPTGARGLNIDNGQQAVICNIGEFPEKMREILDDKELYERLRKGGRAFVEEYYDWKKIAKNMELVLER